jgi:hypothetical protein
MAIDDHPHPVGHTPKAVSPKLLNPRDVASKEDVTPKDTADACPKVDRVSTQGPHV